jgi:hypothetical protein
VDEALTYSLDVRSLLFIAQVSAGWMALLFIVVAREKGGTNRHLAIWSLAFLLKALGLLLVYMRPSIPAFPSYVVGNALVVASVQLFLVGLLLFAGRRPRWRVQAAFFLTSIAVLAWTFRLGTLSHFFIADSLLLIAAETALVVVLLFGMPVGARMARSLVALAFGLELTLLFVRVARNLPIELSQPLFDPTRLTWGLYVELTLQTILLGTALLVLVSGRAHTEEQALIGHLEAALANVRTLQGLLPICAWCKRMRDEDGSWNPLEQYIGKRTGAQFTHGMCPDCEARLESRRP